MFIPLGTDRPLRRPVVLTYALIGLNVAAFAYQMVLFQQSKQSYLEFLQTFAVSRGNFHWYQLITASFLHAENDPMHLIGNMIILYVFGPNLEDRLGRLGFLALYIIGGCAAMGTHVLFSQSPAIGASGCITALTGAYLVMFPRVLIKVFTMIYFRLFWLKAWWFIGLAIVWDMASQAMGEDNVAHAAHLGGYAFGSGVAFALLWLKIIPREPYDLFSATRQAYRRRQIAMVGRDYQRVVQQRVGSDGSAGDGLHIVNDEVAVMRSGVTSLMAAGDLAGAATAYRTLADTYGHLPRAATLSRKNQYDLANYLYVQEDFNAATYAYERFLDAYAKDPEVPQIKLLLGRLYARHLNDPIKAKALLQAAMADLRNDSVRAMAKQELETLG